MNDYIAPGGRFRCAPEDEAARCDQSYSEELRAAVNLEGPQRSAAVMTWVDAHPLPSGFLTGDAGRAASALDDAYSVLSGDQRLDLQTRTYVANSYLDTDVRSGNLERLLSFGNGLLHTVASERIPEAVGASLVHAATWRAESPDKACDYLAYQAKCLVPDFPEQQVRLMREYVDLALAAGMYPRVVGFIVYDNNAVLLDLKLEIGPNFVSRLAGHGMYGYLFELIRGDQTPDTLKALAWRERGKTVERALEFATANLAIEPVRQLLCDPDVPDELRLRVRDTFFDLVTKSADAAVAKGDLPALQALVKSLCSRTFAIDSDLDPTRLKQLVATTHAKMQAAFDNAVSAAQAQKDAPALDRLLASKCVRFMGRDAVRTVLQGHNLERPLVRKCSGSGRPATQ